MNNLNICGFIYVFLTISIVAYQTLTGNYLKIYKVEPLFFLAQFIEGIIAVIHTKFWKLGNIMNFSTTPPNQL